MRWERTRQHLCRHAGTEALLGHPDEHTEQAARERWKIRTEIRAGVRMLKFSSNRCYFLWEKIGCLKECKEDFLKSLKNVTS